MNKITITNKKILDHIYLIRERKVMIDEDLAELYGVETKELNRAVKRNASRFPEDFMFHLSKEEFANLKCQFGTSSWGGRRKLPFVFTEQGVAMLSSVLHTEKAIQVNIQIIRIFTRLREVMLENKDLAEKIKKMESKYDSKISEIFRIIKLLVTEEEKLKEKIGFSIEV